MKIAFHKACETTFLCRKWQICLMKHLEIMPILEASEMISVKFSHEDKDLSILPIFNTLSRIIHPHPDRYIFSNGHTVLLSRFKGKDDISLDIHIVMLLKSLLISQLSYMVIQNLKLLN